MRARLLSSTDDHLEEKIESELKPSKKNNSLKYTTGILAEIKSLNTTDSTFSEWDNKNKVSNIKSTKTIQNIFEKTTNFATPLFFDFLSVYDISAFSCVSKLHYNESQKLLNPLPSYQTVKWIMKYHDKLAKEFEQRSYSRCTSSNLSCYAWGGLSCAGSGGTALGSYCAYDTCLQSIHPTCCGSDCCCLFCLPPHTPAGCGEDEICAASCNQSGPFQSCCSFGVCCDPGTFTFCCGLSTAGGVAAVCSLVLCCILTPIFCHRGTLVRPRSIDYCPSLQDNFEEKLPFVPLNKCPSSNTFLNELNIHFDRLGLPIAQDQLDLLPRKNVPDTLDLLSTTKRTAKTHFEKSFHTELSLFKKKNVKKNQSKKKHLNDIGIGLGLSRF